MLCLFISLFNFLVPRFWKEVLFVEWRVFSVIVPVLCWIHHFLPSEWVTLQYPLTLFTDALPLESLFLCSRGSKLPDYRHWRRVFSYSLLPPPIFFITSKFPFQKSVLEHSEIEIIQKQQIGFFVLRQVNYNVKFQKF